MLLIDYKNNFIDGDYHVYRVKFQPEFKTRFVEFVGSDKPIIPDEFKDDIFIAGGSLELILNRRHDMSKFPNSDIDIYITNNVNI
jgi:hypothetical protein